MRDERGKAYGVFGRMTRMSDFDAVNALVNEGFDPFARSGVRGMRQDRQSARTMNEANGIGNGQFVLGDVRGPSIAKVSVECVAEVDGPPFGDHRPRNVRSADRATRSLLEHRGELDAHAELIQPLDDPF